jgi:riboflavin synthase
MVRRGRERVFSGIVEGTGSVVSVAAAGGVLTLRIDAPGLIGDLAEGGSIAVNGCCLTAVEVDAFGFRCDLTGETLARTAFDERLTPGTAVNLERPLRADGRFDGHIVQGHVDGVGRILELRPLGTAAELRVAPPPELERYLVTKGSVCVDGISLTVADLAEGSFTVAIIPYTLERTNLRSARRGDRVNLEADVIAKYVERLLTAHRR